MDFNVGDRVELVGDLSMVSLQEHQGEKAMIVRADTVHDMHRYSFLLDSERGLHALFEVMGYEEFPYYCAPARYLKKIEERTNEF